MSGGVLGRFPTACVKKKYTIYHFKNHHTFFEILWRIWNLNFLMSTSISASTCITMQAQSRKINTDRVHTKSLIERHRN
jgi:hypothetical protein